MSTAKTGEQAQAFAGLSAALATFKLPGLDMDAVMASRRQDIDALVAANLAAMASMKALSQKQTALLTEAMQGAHDAASQLTLSGAGAPDLRPYAETVRDVCAKTVRDMAEMAEMARKLQTDLMSGLTQRASQSLQEIRAQTQPRP